MKMKMKENNKERGWMMKLVTLKTKGGQEKMKIGDLVLHYSNNAMLERGRGRGSERAGETNRREKRS